MRPWIVLALVLGACRTEVRAQLVVVVASDMRVPDDLDAFRAHVSGQEGAVALNELYPLAGPGSAALPADFGVVPRAGDSSRRVTIDVDAMLGGEVLFTTSAVTSFLPGKRLRVDVFLARQCVEIARQCDPEETCRREGCVPPLIDPEDLPEFTPGEPLGRDAGVDAGPLPPPTFGAPERVDELTTADNEQDPIESHDGLLFVFERPGEVADGTRDLWMASRASIDDPWSDERALVEINTPEDDSNAAFWRGAGSLWLYYVSDYHADGSQDPDVLIAEWRPGSAEFAPWGPVASIDTIDSEKDPCLSDDGEILFFTRPDPDLAGEILEARGTALDAFVDPGSGVPELSSPDADYDPAISGDGLVVVFASTRPPSVQGDLWMAIRPDRRSPFGPPEQLPVGEINTDAEERDPSFNRDGDLYFSSDRGGNYDMYRAPGDWGGR